MVQQIQPKVVAKPIVKKPVVAKPVVSPVQEGQVMPVEGGSIWSKWWIWVIIAVVAIGIGIGIYAIIA